MLPALLGRVRALFDLDARPDLIASASGKDPRLTPAVRANPGLRVPGAFNGFEMGLRAILGQQVTVNAATTIACRLVEAFGEPIVTPSPNCTASRRSRPASRAANCRRHRAARHRRRAGRSIIALAAAQDPARSASTTARITIRTRPSRGWPRCRHRPVDGALHRHARPALARRLSEEDIAVRNRLGGVTAKEAEVLSQAWRPWRSYAVMHLWNMPTATKHGSLSDVQAPTSLHPPSRWCGDRCRPHVDPACRGLPAARRPGNRPEPRGARDVREIEPAQVGLMATLLSVPRGIVAGADVY